jgi:hypothetical protein
MLSDFLAPFHCNKLARESPFMTWNMLHHTYTARSFLTTLLFKNFPSFFSKIELLMILLDGFIYRGREKET